MLLISNGHIKTMAGQEYTSGEILIGDDGKIVAIGECVGAPAGVETVNAGGRLVTPGCVEAHCHIGLQNTALRWEGYDFNEDADPLTPQMRAIDSINPIDEAFEQAIKYGVTTACTGPGSTNVVGGTFAAIKLVGKRVDKMIVKESVAMKCAFGENPKEAFGQKRKLPVTRMGVAAMLRELLFKTRSYMARKDAGENPPFDMKLEAMIPVLRGELPLKAHVHRADDIFTAIRIAKEFGVRLTLDHCTDGILIADELAKEGYPCFVGPSLGRKSKHEVENNTFRTAAVLAEAGVSISIITDAPITPLERLPLCAGYAVSEGLPYEEAWRAITVTPAMQMGIGDRVGSLEVGKDADIVIWLDDPLRVIGVSAYMTVVDGRIVYRAE